MYSYNLRLYRVLYMQWVLSWGKEVTFCQSSYVITAQF